MNAAAAIAGVGAVLVGLLLARRGASSSAAAQASGPSSSAAYRVRLPIGIEVEAREPRPTGEVSTSGERLFSVAVLWAGQWTRIRAGESQFVGRKPQ